ncbi:DUF805 domain-containing protein [Salidesulfovibrio brasiliensis]|uniref:DUF805 domain-containing protein n=1 Tax=Salidesulfovibrio brasiliensis TaxID=221711 RepID=UPI0006D03A64|nr:DUF805 domain-containing protein [Salidesulfovibrio brasiliensis]
MKWFIKVVKNFAVFKGRASRREYWMFILFFILFSLVLAFIDGLIGTFDPVSGFGLLSGLFALLMLLPNIAVTVRRLHDTGRSGLWALAFVIPILNLVLFIFMLLPSSYGDNKYGPDPHESYA